MKKKLIIFISILLFILLFVVIVFITNYIIKFDSNKKIEVELYKCIDGDTVWLERDNKKLKYRLLAIDTPELNEEYGNDSSEYVCNILNNANIIEVEYDVLSEKKDKYNRELVWLFVDGELVQSKLLENGLAEVRYVYNEYNYLDILYNKEGYAKDNKIGIWSEEE